MAKKKTDSVLTGEQLRKVRKLVKSKDAGNVKVAIQLLQSTEATGDNWSDVFSSRTISLMVNTWDLAVWNPVLAGLAEHPRLQSEFHELATDRFAGLSRPGGDKFIKDAFQKMTPQLVTLVVNLAAGSWLRNDGRRPGPEDYIPQRLEYLTTLSDAVAEVLSKYEGHLDLSGLKKLSDSAAESLRKHKGKLSLCGLTSLSDAAAESLSKHKGDLSLGALTSLSDAAAESLSKHKGRLEFDSFRYGGLKSLSDAAAESLSKHKGDLSLGALTSLSDAAAESLSKHKGELTLDGLTKLSDAAAESLSKHKGKLSLCGLTSLSDSPGHVALAESLSKHKGDLWLLTSLSDAAAESLSKHKGELTLSLTSLSDAAAESLSKHKDLDLRDLTSLSDAAAESLSNHKGKLSLSGLTSLSDAAAESLAKLQEFPVYDGPVKNKINKFRRRLLAEKKKKARKTSGKSTLTGEQLRKVRKLVKSKDAANVKMALQLLQAAEATIADWSDIFSSRTISLMVNTWDVDVWDPILAGLAVHPLLEAEFLSLVTERFPRLTTWEGDTLIMNAVKNDFQEMTPQQVLIVATLDACDTSWDRDHLVSFLLGKLVPTP